MYGGIKEGKLSIIICEAQLTRDTEMFSKMDPYVKMTFHKKTYKTRVKDEAGKHPKWNQTFELYVYDAYKD